MFISILYCHIYTEFNVSELIIYWITTNEKSNLFYYTQQIIIIFNYNTIY